jgi:hypothetical protein
MVAAGASAMVDPVVGMAAADSAIGTGAAADLETGDSVAADPPARPSSRSYARLRGLTATRPQEAKEREREPREERRRRLPLAAAAVVEREVRAEAATAAMVALPAHASPPPSCCQAIVALLRPAGRHRWLQTASIPSLSRPFNQIRKKLGSYYSTNQTHEWNHPNPKIRDGFIPSQP